MMHATLRAALVLTVLSVLVVDTTRGNGDEGAAPEPKGRKAKPEEETSPSLKLPSPKTSGGKKAKKMDSVEAKQLDAAEHALLRVPASGKKGIETSSDVADTSATGAAGVAGAAGAAKDTERAVPSQPNTQKKGRKAPHAKAGQPASQLHYGQKKQLTDRLVESNKEKTEKALGKNGKVFNQKKKRAGLAPVLGAVLQGNIKLVPHHYTAGQLCGLAAALMFVVAVATVIVFPRRVEQLKALRHLNQKTPVLADTVSFLDDRSKRGMYGGGVPVESCS